jgi:S1-C subfamily serine protease/tetratricopeptide (TPR) repeat protein
MKKILFAAVFLTASLLPLRQAQCNATSLVSAHSTTIPTAPRLAQKDPINDPTNPLPTPQQVQQTAKNVTVRITSENNGGSGVIIAKKGDSYLILTNAHVVNRSNRPEIQAPDGQKYQAKSIDGGFNSKYDLALLQFTSKTRYTLANLKNLVGTPIEPTRKIYSSGFPFDSKDIRITSGEVSQLTDIPFDDGTQLGYVTNKGEKGIRQGMSGGAIFDAQGNFLGINTLGIAPILPNYTYNDGSKPIPKLAAQYTRANWGIPVYNFLTHVKAEILYGYDNLPKVLHQVTPTGYMAKLNEKARNMTVRIEGGGGNGSGVIVAQQGNTYYVLTAKHVIRREPSKAEPNPAVFDDIKTVTFDQESYAVQPSDITLAEGLDLAIVKFTSKNNYPIATLGDYTPQISAGEDQIAFVGGFPARERIDSPLWQWQLNPGKLFDKEEGKSHTQDKLSFGEGGYNLIYTSISYAGMSGGPIFDTEGRVIGIHGKAEGENEKLILGNSLGISIQSFIGIAIRLKVNPQLLKTSQINARRLSASEIETVIAARDRIPQPQADSTAEQWLQYGNQLYRIKKYPEAIKAFDAAILKRKEYQLQGNYGKALVFLSQYKYDLALAAISTAIAAISTENRQYYYLWKYQSLILQGLYKHDEAIKAINFAIALEPRDRFLRFVKASNLSRNNKYKESIKIFDELINDEPEVYLYISRGLDKWMLDRQAGMDDFALAIKLNPNDTNGYFWRYILPAASKFYRDPQANIDDLTQLIRLDPYDYSWYQYRGLIKLDLGDNKGANIDCDKSIAIKPNASAYHCLGRIKSNLGDKRGAILDYDKSIAINPKPIILTIIEVGLNMN